MTRSPLSSLFSFFRLCHPLSSHQLRSLFQHASALTSVSAVERLNLLSPSSGAPSCSYQSLRGQVHALRKGEPSSSFGKALSRRGAIINSQRPRFPKPKRFLLHLSWIFPLLSITQFHGRHWISREKNYSLDVISYKLLNVFKKLNF